MSGKLLIVHIDTLHDELAKGVAWNIRRYEGRFDEVVAVSIYGDGPPVSQGRSRFRSLGSRNRRRDLLAAPWRVLRAVQQERPDVLLTYDVSFGWWTTLLARGLLRRPLVVVPICLPIVLQGLTTRTLSGLPPRLERLSVGMTFAFASRVVTPASMPTYGAWVDGYRLARRHHVQLHPGIVEGFLGQAFRDELVHVEANPTIPRVPGRMLYVGRLHDEKRADDLVEVLHLVRAHAPEAHLVIVGDGPLRQAMEDRAAQLGVLDNLQIVPSLPNGDLPLHYRRASVFVSPYTGMSLREAGAASTAIVAYDLAEIGELVRHGEDAVLVPSGDVEAMASAVVALLRDDDLRARYEKAIRARADAVWGPDALTSVVERTFDFL